MVGKADNKQKIETLGRDLLSLEKYIQDFFSFVPLPICFVTPKGVFLQTNPAFEAIAGCGLYEIIGEGIETFFDEEAAGKLLKETIKKGSVKNWEMSFVNKLKQTTPVNVFSRSRKDDSGEVSNCFISFFDLTGIKNFQKDLQAAKEALEIRVVELEKFQRLTVDRELKMLELKKENDKLKEQLEKYGSVSR